MPSTKEWFAKWFDSPYYHLLYHERDEDEAKAFIDNLIAFLKPLSNAAMLDVACGKGRHALQLNSHGFEVCAYDLSPSSIEFDKQFENDTLRFYVHDMRNIFRVNYFDYVFNIFSSFGYFESDRENKKVIHAHSLALKKGGYLILDFMNATFVKQHIKDRDSKLIDRIQFEIQKKIDHRSIIKQIDFTAEGTKYTYYEKLRLFTLKNFESIFTENGLILKHTFGNYSLDSFEPLKSERLIMIAQKI